MAAGSKSALRGRKAQESFTRVIKIGASRAVVGGVARSARTAGARRFRGV